MASPNLNNFCAKNLTEFDVGQEYLCKPFLSTDGRACATDKNIAVRFNATGKFEPLKARLVASALEALFELAESKAWLFDSLNDCCDFDDHTIDGVLIGEKYIEQLKQLPKLTVGRVMESYVGFSFSGGVGVIRGVDIECH